MLKTNNMSTTYLIKSLQHQVLHLLYMVFLSFSFTLKAKSLFNPNTKDYLQDATNLRVKSTLRFVLLTSTQSSPSKTKAILNDNGQIIEVKTTGINGPFGRVNRRIIIPWRIAGKLAPLVLGLFF